MTLADLSPGQVVPAWFRHALACPGERRFTSVAGAQVSSLVWGPAGAPGVVLVHGGGAHGQWWDHVAPALAGSRRVVAIDLSGHGWSDHREQYSLDRWTDEVVAVAAASELAGPPVLVGHSMGGFVAIATAALHPADVAGVIACDSPVTTIDPELSPAAHFGTTQKVYADPRDAIARFRTVPPQDRYLPYVLEHVAAASLVAVPGGWTWRFDRRIFEQFGRSLRSEAAPYLARIRCQFSLLRSENGLVTADIAQAMATLLGSRGAVTELPEAGHHPMLDEPLVLIAALRAVLAEWARTETPLAGH